MSNNECISSIPPEQFALLSSLIGIILSSNLDLRQQTAFGNFVINVGQTILTAAAQAELIESKKSQNDHVRQQIKILKDQISMLEDELDNSGRSR